MIGDDPIGMSIGQAVKLVHLRFSVEFQFLLLKSLLFLQGKIAQQRLLMLVAEIVIELIDDNVCVLDRKFADVCHCFYLGCALLDLRVRHVESKLVACSRLDMPVTFRAFYHLHLDLIAFQPVNLLAK